jgi:hypothetical protein
LCAKRKEVVRELKLEEKVLHAVCHAVSAGHASMPRRADALQHAAGLFEGLHNLNGKSNPEQFCSSKQLRTLQVAIKQVEGLDDISGRCTAQLKRLRNLLGMGTEKEAQKRVRTEVQAGSGKVKVKRKRDRDSVKSDQKPSEEKKEKLKKQKKLTQSQE